MELEKLSGVELGAEVNSGNVSPTEVIEYFADLIEKRDPRINAFTYTKFEDAMAEAKAMGILERVNACPENTPQAS